MFTAALFITTKMWKQPTAHQLMEKQKGATYIHTTEYYSAIKRNQVLIHAITWMTPEKIM